MKRCVTLLSGGQDSTTALFWAKNAQPTLGHVALTFVYGQRHALAEVEAARRVASLAGVTHHKVLEIPLGSFVPSALVEAEGRIEKTGGPGGLPTSFVPGRNLIFLSYAAAWCAAGGGGSVVIGASAVDYSGYPDCRPEFLVSMSEAMQKAMGEAAGVQLVTPLLYLSKASTVELARSLPGCWEALGHSWTCYSPPPPHRVAVPCGTCPACELRAKGFADAGEIDPAL
jgi:7-cyano-7-deazaguanine synthase